MAPSGAVLGMPAVTRLQRGSPPPIRLLGPSAFHLPSCPPKLPGCPACLVAFMQVGLGRVLLDGLGLETVVRINSPVQVGKGDRCIDQG